MLRRLSGAPGNVDQPVRLRRGAVVYMKQAVVLYVDDGELSHRAQEHAPA